MKYISLTKKLLIVTLLVTFFMPAAFSQWKNVSDRYQPLPADMDVFYTDDLFNGRAFQAYYAVIRPSGKTRFETAVGNGKRFTPQEYYEREGKPLMVVNTTFFSFETNQNLNMVVKNGKLVAYNVSAVSVKDTDSFYYPTTGAFGISKKQVPDIAWTFTDSSKKHAYALQQHPSVVKGTASKPSLKNLQLKPAARKWKVETAVGGGPVLVQNGMVRVTNTEERKFVTGLLDLHPRTAIGYKPDGSVIILIVAGRMPGIAEGINLKELAELFVSLGCVEALNLDGGGSSCMLINGKETITPSSKGEQRPVPAVLMVR
ncbi:phosphodiester glycosidase family protein [Gynurincola endophyticus]|uniref:phosphodiester glycosidase family protein n=1 Tax=Gynurincola endophyticus TaxID=2479004 RepID=UPI000F8DF2DB|nr:phosphodiester glycosidase family protein [Gynurincola endophyticus]